MKTLLYRFLITLALFASLHRASAQGTTAFTYQGQLKDNGTNANGGYSMIFKLYDAVSAGNQVGSTLTTSVTLANGLFSVNLDFGSVFNGTARWLDITVTNGGVTQTLSPRVQVLPAPYAQFAAVAATVTNGAIMNAQLAGNAVNTTNLQNNAVTNRNLTANAVNATNIANGQVVKSLNGLADVVTFSAGQNVTLTPSGNNIQISAITNSAIIGLWTIDSGTINAPGGPTLSNALRFRSGGVTRLGLDVNGLGVVSYTGFTVVGDINASGAINADTSIYSQGNITANGQMYASSFNTTSDRNLKEKFTPVNSQEVLNRVASLPISSWNFKTDTTRHIGPMAQDFYSAFNVGTDDKHIATVDEDGVALAAIQGLNQKLEDETKAKDAKINELEKRLADLETIVKLTANK